MSAREPVTVYVGTRKGAYVVEGDRKKGKWNVRGPMHTGADVFHVAPDPRVEGSAYALVNSFFFGPAIYRTTDRGKKWKEVGTPLLPRTKQRPPPNFEEDPRKTVRPIVNLWHIEPGPENEPKSMFLGVDPGGLYRSDDRGDSWDPVSALNEHETRSKWNPGAGGLCLHTILIDPTNPRRMHVGISAAGTFRTEDGGEHWRPTNHGVRVDFLPEKYPEFGQCVHDVVMDPADPDTLYRQDHNGIYVSHDAAESWQHVGKSLEEDFGFVAAAPRSAPGEAFFVPLGGMSRLTTEGGMQVWRWQDRAKKWSRTLDAKRWPGSFGTHREGLASDTLDPFGLYLGTTTGQLFYSVNGAKSWGVVPYTFPGIHSVAVASPTGT